MAVETLEQHTSALHQGRNGKSSAKSISHKHCACLPVSVEERAQKREEFFKQIEDLLTRGEYTEALRQTTQAVEEYRTAQDRTGEALTLHLLGSCYKRLNDYPAALTSFQQSYEGYQALGDRVKAANALLAKATVQRLVGQEDAAIQVIQECRVIYRETGEQLQEMRAAMNLSVLLKQRGDLGTSQELLFECLDYYEQSGEKLETAKVLLNIASNYNILENPQQVVHFAKRGIPLFEKCGDLHNLSLALTILAEGYCGLGDWETALEQFRTALLIAEKIDIRWAIAIILGDMGEALMKLRQFEEARDLLERRLHINGKDENRLVYCGSIELLGCLYANPDYAGQDLEKAVAYLTEARILAEDQNYDMLLENIYQSLAEVYEKQGDFKGALEAYRKYHQVRERIFNEKSDKRVKELQTRFEVEAAKKDTEIAHLRSVELVAALKETERLRALADTHARTDILTGVENRRALDERLIQEFARTRRNGQPLTVALLDIDHFKKVNDTFGHSVGDESLRYITRILRAQCRSGDYMARYGGEEFALIFPETTHKEALDICDRLRVWIAASDWSTIHPGLRQVTISIGLSTFTGDRESVESLLAEADRNLYKAKQRGRNRVVGNN